MFSPPPPRSSDTTLNLALAALAALAGAAIMLWFGAALAATLTGHPVPAGGPATALGILANPGNPSRAWHQPMPGPAVYWACTTLVLLAAATAAWATWWLVTRHRGASPPVHALPGTAARREIGRAAGQRALLTRARTIRPSLTRPRPEQVGYRLGRARGRQVWATGEDSLLLLGPPRSGKGLHVVIPMILSAPGAVVTTSTRPDNLAVTLAARQRAGPVAVFDPQQLVAGVPAGLRWSPVRGCQIPQTAMIRARGLAASTQMRTGGVEDGDFWTGQTEMVLRGLLHAAALDGRTARDLYRWSLDHAAAGEAVTILGRNTGAADGWADALDGAINADPRTRDSIWLGVRQALAGLADPRVLAAVTPGPGEAFDPAAFLADHGSLYLLGTAAGAGAAAPLIAAFVEDMVEVARTLAAASPGARLDPPLALILDEIGNLSPLPSLPALMSEGGGSGITTLAVLQSLAQARAGWGEQPAATIWDAAIVKIVLGGASNARDLADLVQLIGERDDRTDTISRDPYGARTVSTSIRRVPILDSGQLRTLPFGTAILLLRSARPIVLSLTPWTDRRDADTLTAQRGDIEATIRAAHTGVTGPSTVR